VTNPNSSSRAKAIAGGALVDLTHWKEIQQHWKLHVACTEAVWQVICSGVTQHGGNSAEILTQLSQMAKMEICVSKGSTLFFSCVVGPTKHDFKLHCGPGDSPIPVLTFKLLHED